MKTKSGILYLTKKEREALRVIIHHTCRNLDWKEGGSFINSNGDYNPKEAAKAALGLDVIAFVLDITE